MQPACRNIANVMAGRSVAILGTILFLLTATQAQAQSSDTSKQKPYSSDTLLKKHPPKAAAIMSAIVPGLGQVYNKKYWKVPLIYGGFAGLGYAFYFHATKYTTYREAYIYRMDKDTTTIDNFPKYTPDNLKTLRDSYRRYRDLFVITMSVLYVLNIVDASVDAHLFTFDVNDNLSLRIQPYINNMAYSPTPLSSAGLTFTFNIRK